MWKEEDQMMNLCKFCTTVTLFDEEKILTLGIVGPPGPLYDGSEPWSGSIHLGDQGSAGPIGIGPCSSHHPYISNSRIGNEQENRALVVCGCGTTWPTRSEI